ncbi:MAG: hypothetical protein HOI35_02645, partial [Woeseia sp.]|nr:hypothetical protein [Woeseia sp.]
MRYLFFIMLLCCLGTDTSAETSFRPANFDVEDTERRLYNLIKWPKDVKGKTSLILTCFGVIKTNGKMEMPNCIAPNSFEKVFTAEIMKASKKARLNPAMINGKSASVFLQFRIEFNAEVIKKEEQHRIDIHLNPGYEENIKAYGYDHIAGQRVIAKKQPFHDACPKRARYVVWVLAYLGETGKAENARVEHSDGIMPTETCREALRQTVTSSQFTPAM